MQRKSPVLRIWVLSFIAVFTISYICLSLFTNEEEVLAEDAELLTWSPVPALCNEIQTVTASGDTVTIEYLKELPTKNRTLISLHFGLTTSWVGQDIFFPPGSAEVSVQARSVDLKFHLPVVDEYQAVFYCVATGSQAATAKEFASQSLRRFKVKLAIPDFGDSDEYSQLRCHYKDEFPRRWCEGRNIPYFNDHLFFMTPAHFQFPEPFIVPGARAPPFDRDNDRLVFEPIPVRCNLSSLPHQLDVITEVCYMTGVFHNSQMLWHALFDFVIPFYHFLKILSGTDTAMTRRVFFRSDGLWQFTGLLRLFSVQSVPSLADTHPQMLMRTAILGMEKLERNPDPNRNYDESISFSYDFDRATALGMREAMLDTLHIPDKIDETPLVVVINRGDARDIENMAEVVEVLKAGCPGCNIYSAELHKLDLAEQIQLVSRASVLFGMHGSGLTHVVWMRESRPDKPTHMVEVVPYKYTCRPWYHTAANVSGVQYHLVTNRNPPERTGEELERYKACWTGVCATSACHDLLRDQPTTVELDVLNETWMKVVSTLHFPGN